jgi:hypothetical protein
VVTDLNLFSNFITIAKGVAHDGNQHVEQMDEHDELSSDEKHVQILFLSSIT